MEEFKHRIANQVEMQKPSPKSSPSFSRNRTFVKNTSFDVKVEDKSPVMVIKDKRSCKNSVNDEELRRKHLRYQMVFDDQQEDIKINDVEANLEQFKSETLAWQKETSNRFDRMQESIDKNKADADRQFAELLQLLKALQPSTTLPATILCFEENSGQCFSSDEVEKEELILMSMDKGDVTGPILAVKEDLGQKLIDDLDEPLMVLESDGMINKNEFAVVAPVVAVAPIVVAPIAVAPIVVAPIAVAPVAPVVVTPVEPSFIPLGRKIKQNQAEQKLGCEICLQEPVPAQRRTWDPGITQYDVMEQHLEDKTPIEVWFGKPIDYSKLHVFGCHAYYHVSEGKLETRGEKGIFMGYGDGVKGYRIWSPFKRRVIFSRDVTFNEDYLFRMKQDPIESKLEDGVSEKVEDVPKQVEHVIPGDTDHDVTLPDDYTNSPHLEHEQDRSIAHDRPHRNAKAPSRFGFEDYVAYALQIAEEVKSLEPATYREAITSKESDMWIAAMGEEVESLYNNNTWELVKLPEKRKVAPTWSLIYLLLYVDDMLVAAKDMEEIKKLKILLNTEFDMKDLGATRKILGIKIIRDQKHGKLFLSQKSYIEKIISRFGMSSAKSVNTPSSANFCLSTTCAPQTEAKIECMSRIPYDSVVGSLMYVMVCTRPNIAHAMSVVSRYMAHPEKEHWNAVKRIFCYLKGISNVGLIYGGEREYLVAGYSVSDYTADLDARRSLTGYVFTIGNLVVSWKATLQPSVALSTTEAEYMALTEATKEGIWLKGLIEDLGFPQDQATVFCDSMSAMCLAKDQVYHDRTKHIDVRYHFICTERRIKVNKIGTEDNPADVFTKPLPLSKFFHYLDLLNIDNWKVSCGSIGWEQACWKPDEDANCMNLAGLDETQTHDATPDFTSSSISSSRTNDGVKTTKEQASSYANKLSLVSLTMAKLWKLEENVPNGANYDVWLPLASVHEGVDSLLRDGPWMIRGIPIFLNKWSPSMGLLKEELLCVPVWVKFHDVLLVAYTSDGLSLIAMKIGTPMIIDSYTNSMCLESWGWSSYARILIKINACNDFSDNLVMVVPNIEGTRYTKETICIEYDWKPPRCSTCLLFGHSLDDCPKAAPKQNRMEKVKGEIPGVDDEVATGSKVTTTGTQEEGQCSVPLVERINVLEKHILENKLVLVDDNGKLLEKVDGPDNSDCDDEVERVENKTASFLASRELNMVRKTCGNNGGIEQWMMNTTHMMMICMKVGKFLKTYKRYVIISISRLERLGHPMPHVLAVNTILGSLPKSFHNFVMNYNMNVCDKTLGELHAILKTAEKMCHLRTQEVEHVDPFKESCTKNAECFHCGKIGHWK
ncbi:retrovirus-related pol polyprotein from transposon TNT 1-94 [Tanacetum coccineum]